ncbi:nucleoid-associated protein [soil metagenome]
MSMRNPSDVVTGPIVIHKVDILSGPDGLKLSHGVVQPGHNANLDKLMKSQIEGSLKDPDARAAAFGEIVANQPSGILHAMEKGDVTLLQASQSLAISLFEAMERRRNVKPGVLAVCPFSANFDGSTASCLAMLKIDMGQVYRTITETNEQGHEFFNMIEDDQGLSTSKENLQKAAFVRKLDPRDDEYDMLILDRQVRKTGIDDEESKRAVAQFFLEFFLKASEISDSPKKTRLLIKAFLSGKNNLEADGPLDPKASYELDQVLETTLAAEFAEPSRLVEELPLEESKKQVFRTALDQYKINENFTIDRGAASTLMAYTRYTGWHGLRISFKTEYKDAIHLTETEETNGTGTVKVITLRTNKLTRVP